MQPYLKGNNNRRMNGCDELEDDSHLGKCIVINEKRSSVNPNHNYFDLFSANVEKQFDSACYLIDGEQIRDEIIEALEDLI